MEKSQAEFVHHRNVANYTRMLRDTSDAGRRKILLSLLGEEAGAMKANGWFPILG